LSAGPVLRTKGAGKVYEARRSPFGPPVSLRALGGVDLEIRAGETLAIVGRSGAGKSTLARCLAGLDFLTEGELWLDGTRLWPGSKRPAPGVQLVFQDSPMALNPRWSASDLIAEPLRLRGWSKRECSERIQELLDETGLPTTLLDRRPGELSGGQRQRVAIARAIAPPGVRFLILDEPLSGLDSVNRQRILALLAAMRQRLSLGLVYVSHELAMVRTAAQRIVVLDQGRPVEQAPVADFFAGPRHEASRALLAAMLPDEEG
jgi:peptide/nickel transport system ATP-binding protein